MMKKWLAILLLSALLLCGAALAEEGAGVDSAIRGKTLILRMTDAWIQEKIQHAAPHAGWMGDTGQSWTWYSPASEHMLCQFAEGDSAADSGSAILPACMQSHDFEMSLERIDGDWYAILRLRDYVQGEKEVLYELCNVDYSLSGPGVLTARETGCVTEKMLLNPRDMNAAKPGFTAKSGNLEISLYPVLGATAAVITEENADPDLLEGVQLVIDYGHGALMNGYMDGATAVYCCMLRDDEAQALRMGALFGLYRRPFAVGADYDGSNHAIVQKGTGLYGILDAQGEWAVQPQYLWIGRPEAMRNSWDTPRPFYCTNPDGALDVRSGEDLQVIVSLKNESFSNVNPSVFTAYTDNGTNVYSLRTGEMLFSTDAVFAEFGDHPPRDYVKPEYIYLVEGYPERLVIQRGATGSGAEMSRLADNYGNIIAGEWEAILPLMWIGERGVFLTQEDGICTLDYASIDFWDDYIYTNAGDPAWRCGLIDENGAVIAECEYTGVRILSREEIQLRNSRGEWESFFWME